MKQQLLFILIIFSLCSSAQSREEEDLINHRTNTQDGVFALFSLESGSGFAGAFIATTFSSAFGYGTLSYSTGSYNTASGAYSLRNNLSGQYNTASGYTSLRNNISGSNNSSYGFESLVSNKTGEYNTVVGSSAMRYNEAGHLNTSVGTYSLIRNTTGSFNAALGFNAGSTGNHQNSTFIGSNANATTNVTNSTAIGNEAVVTASNQVRIGNVGVTSIGGQVEWTTLSDGRFKKNIKEDVPGLSFITKLRPVTYALDVASLDNKLIAKSITSPISSEVKVIASTSTSAINAKEKEERTKVKYTGFVAQEVEEAAKKIGFDFSGVDAPKNGEDLYGLRYSQFVVPLVKSVQELSKKNEQLEQENKEIKEKLGKIEEMMNKLLNNQSTSGINNTAVSVSGAYLVQNAPNPFSGTTIIRYHLPGNTTSAKIIINNSKGQLMKSITLNTKGDGQVTLDAGTLAAGSYTYTLWLEGRQADSKQMIIQK